MTEPELIDIARDTVLTTLMVAAPPLLVGLVAGLAISILQTITQIQEMTLTFVPKVILIFASLIIFLPYMLSTMSDFWKEVLDIAIVGGGTG